MNYFAWVDEIETEFGEEHMREDEELVSFVINHKEGEYPSLTVVIKNPRVGLLAPGRYQWAWLSDDDGPLFFGRLLGLPTDLINNCCTLNFTARPLDFVEQKLELAETLKVRPYWDPIFFAPDTVDDPDNVLESRPALWHIDRVTHVVTISDLVSGEDGSLIIPVTQALYDSVSLTYSQSPARAVVVTASVTWDQKAFGGVDITQQLKALGDGFTIESYTGRGLVEDWPKNGTNLGGGWFVSDGSAFVANTQRLPEEFIDETNYDIRLKRYAVVYNNDIGFTGPFGPRTQGYQVSSVDWGVYNPGASPKPKVWFPLTKVTPTLVIGYDATRGKGETLQFTLASDVQSILTEPADTDIVQLNFTTSEVANPIDPGGEMPLGDVRNGAFFTTDRGEQAIEYLLCVARATLLGRARMVRLQFEVPYAYGRALELSCRKNALLTDPRLPGGQAAGKIAEYTMSKDGDTGKGNVIIIIACTVGKGNTITQTMGTPDYVDDDYVEDEYQFFDGYFSMPIAGVLQYESINGLVPDENEVDYSRLTPSRVITSLSLTNSALEQEAHIEGGAASVELAMDKLNEVPTTINLGLVNLEAGPLVTPLPLNVAELMIPKTIDLEAPSS